MVLRTSLISDENSINIISTPDFKLIHGGTAKNLFGFAAGRWITVREGPKRRDENSGLVPNLAHVVSTLQQ